MLASATAILLAIQTMVRVNRLCSIKSQNQLIEFLSVAVGSMKSGALEKDTLSPECLDYVKAQFQNYLENILGLKEESSADIEKLDRVLELLIDIRKEARTKKDYATSDKIRNQLLTLGIALKDEKDGNMSWGM